MFVPTGACCAFYDRGWMLDSHPVWIVFPTCYRDISQMHALLFVKTCVCVRIDPGLDWFPACCRFSLMHAFPFAWIRYLIISGLEA